MKLLFISRLFPNARQPYTAAYNRQLLNALQAQGVEVQVVAPVPWRDRQGIPEHEVIAGIEVWHPVFTYPPGFLRASHAWCYRMSVRQSCAARVNAWRPDHVMLGFLWPDAVGMASWCQDHALPWSVRVNGSDFRVRIQQPFYAKRILKTLAEAQRIFCPGQALKRDMAQAGINPDKVVAFGNGINHDVFYPPSSQAQRTGVLYVGHLKAAKGVATLIRAWMILSDEERSAIGTLTLVGGGPDEARMKALAQRLQGGDSIVFKGECRHDEVAETMRGARLLCLPSESEGMPNVVLEALACGCPVAATDVGEIPDMVRDGETGVLLAATRRDDEGLAAMLRQVIRHPWNHQTMADSVRHCSWDRAARTVLEGMVKQG